MFDSQKIKELILASLVADSYSLGSHWIYDKNELKNLNINWQELNDAQASWHKNKKAGEFTHYGDQIVWLYEFLKDEEKFDESSYVKFWQEKMKNYDGYIDGASKNTLENIKNNISPCGSNSTDLSVVGRISVLLLVSKTKEEFLKNVEVFVKCSHNSNEALSSSKYFANLLWDILSGKDTLDSIEDSKNSFDENIQKYIQSAKNTSLQSTFDTLNTFGTSCSISGGFPGIMHLLFKYDNLKELLIQNAKAGGDTSARAMVASIIFAANSNLKDLPSSWFNIKKTIV